MVDLNTTNVNGYEHVLLCNSARLFDARVCEGYAVGALFLVAALNFDIWKASGVYGELDSIQNSSMRAFITDVLISRLIQLAWFKIQRQAN